MKHVLRVFGALVKQVLFLTSLFFLYQVTGRASVVLFVTSMYMCRALIIGHGARRIGVAWRGIIVGVVALANSSVDLRIEPASAMGASVEKNGWASLAKMDPETGEYVNVSEEPVSWGHDGCFVDYNAAKWLVVVGLGQETDWIEAFEREYMLWRLR